MKRITWWPQGFLGIVFNFGVLMGWSAVTGIIEWPALILYVAAALWTLAYDTIYAHQDKEDDALIGIKSSALKLGENSALWVKRFYGASWALVALAAFLQDYSVLAPLFLTPALFHMIWQMKTWQPKKPKSALAIFKASRDYGLLILLGLSLSHIHLLFS